MYSASWGPTDNGETLEGPGYLARQALIKGVTQASQIFKCLDCCSTKAVMLSLILFRVEEVLALYTCGQPETEPKMETTAIVMVTLPAFILSASQVSLNTKRLK